MRLRPRFPRGGARRSCGTGQPRATRSSGTPSASARISSVDNDGSRRPCSRKPTWVRKGRCAFRANHVRARWTTPPSRGDGPSARSSGARRLPRRAESAATSHLLAAAAPPARLRLAPSPRRSLLAAAREPLGWHLPPSGRVGARSRSPRRCLSGTLGSRSGLRMRAALRLSRERCSHDGCGPTSERLQQRRHRHVGPVEPLEVEQHGLHVLQL